jgi:RNA polymerase sigma-B factor
MTSTIRRARGPARGAAEVPRTAPQLQSLAPAATLDLFRRWRFEGDRHAREQLVRIHLPLARKLAGRYVRTHEPFDDLMQVASLGLVKAIDRFDPDRGVAFSSFAVPTMLGELKRHFRDKGSAIHLPRGLQELVLRVQNAEARLSSQTGHSPTIAEIAAYLDIDGESVLEALEAIATRSADSLDAPIESKAEDGSVTQHDTYGADDERYALVDTTATLSAALKRLRPGDRRVLALRVGQQLKQREIADRIGVSQMEVSRILRRIREQIHDQLGPS